MENRIKEVRKAMKLTQEAFAELIENEQRNLSNWERGAKEPSLSSLIKIARVTNTSIDYLLCLTDENGIQTKQAELSPDQQSLLDTYSMLDSRHKEVVRGFASQQLDNQLLTQGMVEIQGKGAIG